MGGVATGPRPRAGRPENCFEGTKQQRDDEWPDKEPQYIMTLSV